MTAAMQFLCRSVAHEAAKMRLVDGLLPEWLVYHELAETGRATLRKVCAVERIWLEGTLTRLRALDTGRLSGGRCVSSQAGEESKGDIQRAATAAKRSASSKADIGAAKARALARRAANIAKKKGKT
jgi:ATP-dependent RNA helicase DHX8/PRP22